MVDNLNNIKVYHGSYTEVQTPDLNKCKESRKNRPYITLYRKEMY